MNRRRRRWALVLAILLLAFALRLVALDARPLWYDEAFSVLLAQRGPAAIAAGTAADTMPPGYYLLLYAWMNAFGQTAFALRMLSVSLSLLVVAVVYILAKKALGGGTAAWASLLAALMPFQIYHAQELRMYTLLALGVGVYAYGVLKLTTGGANRRRALVLVAAGMVMALYAHNLAFVSLLAGNLYLGIQALRRRQPWRRQAELIGAQLVGLMAFLPWLWYVPTQLEKIQRAFWTQPPGLLDVVQMLMLFTAYLPLPPWLIAVGLFVSVLGLVLAAWQAIKGAQQGTLPALGLVVTFGLTPPLLLFVLSYLIRPVFVPRAAIGSALFYAILLAAAAARAPRIAQIALFVFVAAGAAALLPFYYSGYDEWRRAPFAQADAFLAAQWRAGDVILHDNKLSFFPMYFYDSQLPQQFLADPPDSDNDTLAPGSQAAMQLYPTELEPAIAGRARVWFVIYQTAIDEAAQAAHLHANLARLDARLQRGPETDYGDLRIFLYTPR